MSDEWFSLLCCVGIVLAHVAFAIHPVSGRWIEYARERLNPDATQDSVDGLRIFLIFEGPDEWYAQGIDVDYLAQGDSREAAKDAFSRGWKATVEAQKSWRK